MKGRLWWSVVLSASALTCLTVATPGVVNAQSSPTITGTGPQGSFSYSPRSSTTRRPGLINPLCGLDGGPSVASAACDSQDGREWEGTASTDYFNFEPSVISPPNPDIAAGPDDILTLVNRTISRYDNPNSPKTGDNNPSGAAPVPYSPAGTYFLPPTSKNFLDVWVGEAALNQLCPTLPRSNFSCVIDNGTIRYDQMQGRFVVLFTATDTGLVNSTGIASANPATRRASWVLIVSRWATGCQGVGGGFTTSCVPDPTQAVPGSPGNTLFFTTPQPPGPSQANPNSGGVSGNWLIYYGAVANASVSQGNDGLCPSGGCTRGNINEISDLDAGGVLPATPVPPTIDCSASAIGDSTRVCYFPTSARLGLDNDNIIIVSGVINDNVPLANRSQANPAFWGSRVRLLKKAAIYIGLSSTPGCANPLCPGSAQNTIVPVCTTPGCPPNPVPTLTPIQGDFYDLWDASPTPYTIDMVVSQAQPNGQTLNLPGLFWEPVHVRGRSLASFNGNAELNGGFTVLLGAVSTTTVNQTQLYMRTITYSRTTPGTLLPNTGGTTATVNTPLIVGGIPTMQTGLQTIPVPGFVDPNAYTQRAKLVQPAPNNPPANTPYLYVGDARPHRAIFREGEVYDARVISTAGNRFDNPAVALNGTVAYDIIQKLGPASAPLSILYTTWGNGRYYSPMFDTPANVIQYGSISPINLGPYLEKLFVGTTFPPLSPSDPRTFSYGLAPATLLFCKDQQPGVNTGGPESTSSLGTSAYPGLWDMRCGEDAYDTYQAYRHPVTGGFNSVDFNLANNANTGQQIVPFGIRGGAATDVNNMGMWLYGAYAKGRLASVPGFGQWGTYVAFYPLTFPIRDPYNNRIAGYTDVPPGNPYYTFVQIAKQTEIDPGARAATTFNPDGSVLRRDMATWVIRAQMDENAITNYLNATGGIYCSFADVACPGSSGVVTNTTGASTQWRYIETMSRRGYTKGCEATNDGQHRFCPDRTLTRGEMAVFVVRAKMNGVFPTVVSGAFTTTTCQPPGTAVGQVGDQFGLFAGCNPYFSDVPKTHIYFAFIQKLRELRISNGTSLPATNGQMGTYGPDLPMTRGQLMTFLVRAFFP